MWMASAFLFYLSIDIAKSTVDYLQHPVKTCRIGDVVENECNKCLCTTKSVFECTPIDCNKKQDLTEPTARQHCLPNQLYVQNLITCICTKDGRWPHKSCYDTFGPLPPSTVVKYQCDPNTYVTIDCNVCRCGSDGNVIVERCTRNICEVENKRRASAEANNIFSTCEMSNWYSLAQCQFCYCVNENKLVCNTGHYYSKNLELGTYSLRICGQDFIKEALELIPDNQKLLRYGLNKTETSSMSIETTTISKPALFVDTESQKIAIEVNREVNENFTNPNKQLPIEESESEKEYYTDIEVETPKPRGISTVSTPLPKYINGQLGELLGPSTKFPFVDGDELLSEPEELNEDESTELIIDLEQPLLHPSTTTVNAPSLKAPSVKVHKQLKAYAKSQLYNLEKKKRNLKVEAGDVVSRESNQYGNTLQINLPDVLNQVFELALRKSMVSLTSGTQCVPGTTSLGKCNNTCFCLKNSKLLCTNNPCKKVAKD